jgi:hypothetical protein
MGVLAVGGAVTVVSYIVSSLVSATSRCVRMHAGEQTAARGLVTTKDGIPGIPGKPRRGGF